MLIQHRLVSAIGLISTAPRVVVSADPFPADVGETINLTATVANGTPSGNYSWEYREEGGAWTPLPGTLSTNSQVAADGLRHVRYRVSVNVTPDDPKYPTQSYTSSVLEVPINPGLGSVTASVSEESVFVITEAGELITTETGEEILTG